MDARETDGIQYGKGYRRCFAKAMEQTGELLREEVSVYDQDRIHSVKSVLYAAIERAGMESERFLTAQELLRELLTLVALQADPREKERRDAYQILEKLKTHHSS